ncbi:MAG: hypothetical protein AAF483_23075 [Planctomycetota bacterium]
MRHAHYLAFILLTALASTRALAQPIVDLSARVENSVLICDVLHAKTMPTELEVNAMAFTGPPGDGRRGSAGFVVQTKELIKGAGTQWQFLFQRDASGFGFQVIHPFKNGQVVVSLVGSTVSIHRGGDWSEIGWGNPDTNEPVELADGALEILPLPADKPQAVLSRLNAEGQYELWIAGFLICTHRVDDVKALKLKTGKKGFWLGSSWDKTTFKGDDFRSKLKPGEGGLILGPMDGSGPRHRFENIRLAAFQYPAISISDSQPENRLARATTDLTATPPAAVSDEQLEQLLVNVESLRQKGKVVHSNRIGGKRGGEFKDLPEQPAVLIGFRYTESRHYASHLTIKAIQPIYLGREGEFLGKWYGNPWGKPHELRAKSGFAVAGVISKWGNRIDGMRLLFMEIKGGRLNPDSTCRSDWVGGLRGSPELLCGFTGNPIIGIHGLKGNDLDALGFIQADQDFSRPAAEGENLEAVLPKLIGQWTFRYTNETQHVRTIMADGRLKENGKLVRQDGDTLIIFDNAIERITLQQDRVLVEHFNPKSNYPTELPAVMGVGKRDPEQDWAYDGTKETDQ